MLAASAQSAVVTYEVLGTVGLDLDPTPPSLVGQPFRIIFSYDTTSLETIPDNTDGDYFLGTYVSGEVFLTEDSISLFSDVKLGRRPSVPPGIEPTEFLHIWLGISGGGRQPSISGIIPDLAIFSLTSFRPDGRLLPPGGEIISSNEHDSLLTSGGQPGFVSTFGDLRIREVPEPGSAILAILGALWLYRRQRG